MAYVKLSEATNIDSILMQEQSAAPDDPASGYGRLYVLDDGTLHFIDDGSTDTDLLATAAHASTHETSGGDEIDGDKLDIDWNPSNYTPATTPSEADSVDNLTAHLYGIDQALTSSGLYTSVAILRDEKATTTNGGSSSATTWNNRDLNTEVYDPDAIVTISSNQFTPISGDYVLVAHAPAAKSNGHRLRLYNVTGGSSVDEGLNNYANTTDGETIAHLMTQFTANGTDAYRIDHYTANAAATNGLGVAVSDGSNEVYLEIRLYKLS